MFKKILIANRGEIACRVAATARRLAIATVAVYSDADAHAAHVAACGTALHIGGSAPSDSYLRADRIIAAALASGAEAVHPGYGFLSENAAFAQACADAGLVFIGPPPAAIRAMGLKAESKQLMERAGVPLVAGYHGADQDPARLQREAEQIGYPVLIKASAGGGGKGMRVVAQAQDFAAALASCQREARSSFGNDAVLIEQYVERPRHIEIQIFGDTLGNYVHLFERDCSVQRRHQKVLEEAPAPGLSAALRQQMGAAAIAAARAVHYVGAGTVEFIVAQPPDAPLAFFFMEMNTRLQVEHPVTEAITGQDLVEWQLRVAAGQALPLSQAQLQIDGHAIEARICAENPDHDFLPSTGRLLHCQLPPGAAFTRAPVRIDAGVRQGDVVTPFYDPLLAKLTVHGADRAQALARMDAALAQLRIVGVANNVQFLRHLLRSPSFAQAELDTGLIPREAAVLFQQEKLGLPLVAAAVLAQLLLDERATQSTYPFSQRDGWRVQGAQAVYTRHFWFEFQGQTASAELRYLPAGALHLQLGAVGGALLFSVLPTGPAAQGESTAPRCIDLQFAGQRHTVQVLRQDLVQHVFCALGASSIVVHEPLQQAATLAVQAASGTQQGSAGLGAPMPGKLLSFAVKVGERVQRGQTLALMEAMKMEHNIAAPFDGCVRELLYAPGDQVAEGAALLILEALA